MSEKTYISEGDEASVCPIGATLSALGQTIASRRCADEESYTYRLLTDSIDTLVKKVIEESSEVALAAKDIEAHKASHSVSGSKSAEEEGLQATETLGECEARDTINECVECDALVDHLRYEAADVMYHLMVILERYNIDLDEFAAELNNRMNDNEQPAGALHLYEEHVRRGK